jgi:hypothetical protein
MPERLMGMDRKFVAAVPSSTRSSFRVLEYLCRPSFSRYFYLPASWRYFRWLVLYCNLGFTLFIIYKSYSNNSTIFNIILHDDFTNYFELLIILYVISECVFFS